MMINIFMIRFIHIPKNGGQSITKWFQENQFDVKVGKNFLKKNPKYIHRKARSWEHENISMFTIVRNPYTRTVSYYNYFKRIKPELSFTFEEFVKEKIKSQTKIPSPWTLQKEWVVNDNDEVIVKDIIKYENMESGLTKLFKTKCSLPSKNVSTYDRNYKKYYTDKLQELVYNELKEDFLFFNYSQDDL